MKNTALICGLVRDAAAYNDKLDTLFRWRVEGCLDDIVVSTWLGELSKFPEIRERLRSGGVRVVETLEPEVFYKGHAWHQMKTLAFGLEVCEPGSAVLKLRGDKIQLTENLRDLLAKREVAACAPPRGWPSVFRGRISTPAGILTQPFFLNDMLFHGFREDLAKLVSFDVSMQISGALMNVEQVFFLAPFISYFPVFHQFFRVNWGLLHFEPQRQDSRRLIRESWNYEFYREAMMTWFVILKTYFGLIEAVSFPQETGSYASWDLDSFFDIDRPGARPGVYFDININSFNFNTLDFLEALLERGFARDELAGAVQSSLEDIMPYKRQVSYTHHFLGLDPSAMAWAEFVRRFPYGGMQLMHLKALNEKLWQVHTPPFRLKSHSHGEACKRLCDELVLRPVEGGLSIEPSQSRGGSSSWLR